MRTPFAAALVLVILGSLDATAQITCRYDPARGRWKCPPGQIQMYGRPHGAPTPYRPRGRPCPIYQQHDCWYGPRPMPGPLSEEEGRLWRRAEAARLACRPEMGYLESLATLL